jgi:hypothetical protein
VFSQEEEKVYADKGQVLEAQSVVFSSHLSDYEIHSFLVNSFTHDDNLRDNPEDNRLLCGSLTESFLSACLN